jgi:hypothetical protein
MLNWILEGAYVDTKFEIALSHRDHYELGPVRIYASLLVLQDLELQTLLRKETLYH